MLGIAAWRVIFSCVSSRPTGSLFLRLLILAAAVFCASGNSLSIQHVKAGPEEPTRVEVVGGVVRVHLGQDAGDAASAAWPDAGLVFTAVDPGVAGNDIQIEFVDPVDWGQSMQVQVDGGLIQVFLPTNTQERASA
ncbi:MAG TPA: hypothetical protein DIT64_17215 [Verrucomicrobiales bacterium]|nr:hypothetical protein [Verrucomicrobiales bacterium]